MRPRSNGDGRGGAFSPGEAPVRPEDPAVRRANLRRVAALFRPYRAPLASVLGLIFVSAALGMATPFLVRDVFDRALPDGDTRRLNLLVGAMIAIAVATAVLGVAQTWLSNVVGQRVMHDLRAAVYRHLQRRMAIAVALLGLAAMASRGLYGVALDGRVERIEIRHEKHPPIDDVHLVYIDGDSTHVDRQLARRFSRGVPLHKGRLDDSVMIGGRTVDLRPSTDLRRAAVVMPLMLLLIGLLLAVRNHTGS